MNINVDAISQTLESQTFEWQQPIPLNNKQLPSFNTNVYPKWLKDYVDAVAEETQTPKDAAGITALGMLSTALSKKFEVQVLGRWKEPLNTYTVVSLPPSSRKSAVFNLLLDPVYEFEQDEARLEGPIIRKETEKAKRLELRIKKLEEKYQKVLSQDVIKPEDEKKLKVIEEELDKEVEKRKPLPRKTRLFASDVTPERLAELLQNHGEKMTVASAEGGEVFKMMSGQYSKMVNIDLYLKGWSADSTIIDRRNNPDGIMLRKPAITMMLMVQPSVIQEQPKEFFDRGFPQRVIFSLPKAFNGYRDVRPKLISDATSHLYRENVTSLLKMKLPEEDPEENHEGITLSIPGAFNLKFDAEADEYLKNMQIEIEHLQRNQDMGSAFNEWIGKLVGQIIRIAGLLHVAEYAECSIENVPSYINRETISKADSLRDYLIQHAEAAFGIVGENENFEDVKYIIKRIKELSQKDSSLNYRELHQAVNKRFKSEPLKNILTLLEEMSYIRCEKQGRKTIIHINPLLSNEVVEQMVERVEGGGTVVHRNETSDTNVLPQMVETVERIRYENDGSMII